MGENISEKPKEGENVPRFISEEELGVLINTLGFVNRVKIGYIRNDGIIDPMVARLITESPSSSGPGSGVWVETGVGKPQFVRRNKIAYLQKGD